MATAPAVPTGAPAIAVPVTPTPAAAGAPPPPPPPAAPSTVHAGWGAVPNLPGRSVTGWYTNVYLAILAYLALPIFLAVLCNLAGWQGGVWGTLLLSTLVDLWVIFHPWTPTGLSLAAYLRGQPGGEKGLSIQDGVNKAEEWLKKVYTWLAAVILGKQIALVALAFLPVHGFGGIALAILAVLLLVVIGNTVYSERPWVISFFWKLYTWILLGLLGYWIFAGLFFPQLRQAAAYSVVTSAQQNIRDQNDAFLKGEADKIRTKLEEMSAGLSEEERVAKLSDKEKAIWAKAQASSFTQKSWTEGSGVLQRSYAAIAPTVKDAVGTVKGAVSKPAPAAAAAPAGKASAQTAWSCDTTIKVVDYTPSDQLGAVDIGSLPAGRYEVTATGKRRQMFFAGTATDPVPSQLCEMDATGRIGFCWSPDGQKVVRNMNGQPWFAPPSVPGSEPLLITEESVPYGVLVIHAMGARLPIAPAGRRTVLDFDQDFPVALNVNRFQGVRNHEGNGALQVTFKQCTKS